MDCLFVCLFALRCVALLLLLAFFDQSDYGRLIDHHREKESSLSTRVVVGEVQKNIMMWCRNIKQ